VQVRWDYPRGHETSSQPDQTSPQVIGGDVLAHRARFFVPASQRLIGAGAAMPAETQELFERAQAHLRLTGLLAAQDGGKGLAVVAAQQRFYAALRHLEQSLVWHLATAENDGSDELQKKARALRQQNIDAAKTLRYEQARVRAESEPWAAALGRLAFAPLAGGIPVHVGGAAEMPRLRSLHDLAAAEHRYAAELLLLAGVGLLALSYLRHGLQVARALSPELLAVAAVVGLFCCGVTPLGITLLVGAVGARLLSLGRRFIAPEPRPAKSSQ
jgi:hypothetical protein